MAGTEGNKNSSKANRMWGDALRRSLAQSEPEKLRKIADVLVSKAAEGDLGAIKELADRLDGKSVQQTTVSGDPDNPVLHSVKISFE
jgi:hypothetical protein